MGRPGGPRSYSWPKVPAVAPSTEPGSEMFAHLSEHHGHKFSELTSDLDVMHEKEHHLLKYAETVPGYHAGTRNHQHRAAE